uniref:Uncharacterized protein n=1 Tax=Anguilla anguilla TaxID=7936 RepID=A0A0E9QZ54_ANGAN
MELLSFHLFLRLQEITVVGRCSSLSFYVEPMHSWLNYRELHLSPLLCSVTVLFSAS